MKYILLSISLLSSSIMRPALPNNIRFAYDINKEQVSASQQDEETLAREADESEDDPEEDAFEALMDDDDVPSDMIVAPRPVSPCEAYLKEIGVQILMKYIALKIWIEHQWQSLSK